MTSNFVPAPTDAFHATAWDGDEYETINAGVVFKFLNEIVDRLGSYDVTTGKC